MKDQKIKAPEKFYFTKDGKKEEVAIVRWIWAVVYNDDTELKQYDMDGVFHQFKEIDQAKVKLFVMLNVATGMRFDIVKKEGMKIFHFYRTCGTMDGNGRRENKIFVFGYETKKRFMVEKKFHYIMPNDTLLITDRDTNLESFGAFKK